MTEDWDERLIIIKLLSIIIKGMSKRRGQSFKEDA